MIAESRKFKGVTDGVNTLSNESGISQGVDGDGFKLGGSRVSLELVCGDGYERCEKSKTTGELILDSKQRVIFIGDSEKIRNLEDFLASEDGKKMAGITGGVQGAKGTLYGIPYAPGSWIDRLVESFAGAHDMIGGKVVGVYNEKGNIKDQRGPVVGRIQDYWSLTGAVVASSPFAMSTLLPSDVWTAISIFLRASR
jgi:filamentous hemagglutinin